jgi:type II secretory pathway component GspD/PulD (secretin)
MKPFPIVLLLAAGCAAAPTNHELRGAEPDPVPHVSVPVAESGFTLGWSESSAPGVRDLLDEYGRATGQTVVATAETLQVIRKKDLERVDGRSTLDVPAASVHEVTEALLLMHQFVLVPFHEADPRIVQVVSLETNERNFVRRAAIFVPGAELDAWRGRAATLITTTLHLPHTDVRTLSNSMRAMLTDGNTQQIVPVGNSNSLILTGLAGEVWALAENLLRIDALEAADQTSSPSDDGAGG